MSLFTPEVVKSLSDFILNQVIKNKIEYLIPLESKGALLVDLALGSFPPDQSQPEIIYLRGLEYLPKEKRERANFGVFDDFVFSGRTIERAMSHMNDLGIDEDRISPLAFFKFSRLDGNEDARNKVLLNTIVPSEGTLIKLSQDEILNEVQKLAIDQKVPASYDNLNWDIDISAEKYRTLMQELARAEGFLYYGMRGRFDASVLLIHPDNQTVYSALPKLRLWYDASDSRLLVSPISFPVSRKEDENAHCSELVEILTPDLPSKRQRSFAIYQSKSICQQVELLGYLKPYIQKHELLPKLNHRHLERYFSLRSEKVIKYINDAYVSAPKLIIPVERHTSRYSLDFYWIAVDIMRALGKAFWTQTPPRSEPRGYSVSQFIDMYTGKGNPLSVHAAIDYCADMNFIATFYGWNDDLPFRSFRLTENGEAEVGRNDGVHKLKLTFIEKLGSLILSKSENREAFWWVLEKIPSILMRRFNYQLPQIQAAKNFYGDTTVLRPNEHSQNVLTWNRLKTEMWSIYPQNVGTPKREGLTFRLSENKFDEYQDVILSDDNIIKVIGPIETLLELTKSKKMGHHVAILLDILSDGLSGTTYLATAVKEATDLIVLRESSADSDLNRTTSRDINNWLEGLDEKIILLDDKRENLFNHMNRTVEKLTKQRRGDLALQLVQSTPFSPGNRIIPSFKSLGSIVKRLNRAKLIGDDGEVISIASEIVKQKNVNTEHDDVDEVFYYTIEAINNWAAALSGEEQTAERYEKERLEVQKGEVFQLYIIAYDLIGSSGELYTGREGSDRDRWIQSIISNWFIAFGGYTQRAVFGGGDLGFGFFHSASNAIQAALWANHHLDQIRKTNRLLKQEKPYAGFGIVRDQLRSGFMAQVKSDWMSRFSKAWKREAERIADCAGRDGKPIIAIHSDLFSAAFELPPQWIESDATLDGIPVRYIKGEAISQYPWTKSGLT